MKYILTIITGFSSGVIIGGSIVAFFTMLGVLTKIIEIGKGNVLINNYKWIITISAFSTSLIYFYEPVYHMPKILVMIIGLFMGIFIGMVISALAETLNIITISSNILGIVEWIYILVFFIIAGKIIGSSIYWLFPGFY